MEFTAKKASVTEYKTECAVVFVEQKNLLPSAKALDKVTDEILTAQIKSQDLKQETGSTILLNTFVGRSFKRILLVQLGKPCNKKEMRFSTQAMLKVIDGITTAVYNSVKDATLYFDSITLEGVHSQHWLSQQTAQALIKKSYQFDVSKSKKSNAYKLKKVTVASNNSAETSIYNKGLLYGNAFGQGINHARELGNLPANICTPTYLATEAKKLAKNFASVTSSSLNEKQMEKLGMGSLLSVSRGSEQEARLITIEYKGKNASEKPHVIVGKGITFDTGGISLKGGSGMDEMKFDMCGAASVVGTITALATIKAKVNVVGIIAAAENMPSGLATKPGDVVTSMSGKTIEVLNTDAEGRLVLCDALTYVEKFKPKSVVDIATLTGACVVALGHHATAVYSNTQNLADALINAGESAHDRAWQMPLWDEYQKQLKSNFADIANIGGRPAGSITAACFLSRFTKKYRWAHLDIAGTAWHSGSKKGSTGRPVSLLTQYLLDC